MQRIAIHLFISVSLTGIALGCGSDDDRAPDVSTGLPAQEKLSDIPEADVHSVCDAIERGAAEIASPAAVERLVCTGGGIAASTTVVAGKPAVDVAMCEDFVKRCEADKTTASESGGDFDFSIETQCADAEVTAKLDRCEATVAEFEACLNSTLSTVKALFASLTCAAFEDFEAAQKRFQDTTPATLGPECEALESKCAGLFDDLRGTQHDDI